MSDLNDFYLFAERQSELLEVVDWTELYPVKKYILGSFEEIDSLFYFATREVIKS